MSLNSSRGSIFGGSKFGSLPFSVIEIDQTGNLDKKRVTIESILKDIRNEEKQNVENSNGDLGSSNISRAPMHIRDLKMFSPFDLSMFSDTEEQLKIIEGPKHPAILARPSAKCFLLELEHIKLLCKRNYCMVLLPSQDMNGPGIENVNIPKSVDIFIRSFVTNLTAHLIQEQSYPSTFEMSVLEVIFSSVTSKLMRHLAVMKPVLEQLMHQILSANPPTEEMLRKILALKQNMTKFENDVNAIQEVVQNVLSSDQDMADLRLTCLDQVGQVDISEHEEVELLLEAFNAYLNYIGFELKRMDADVKDVEDFVTIHLNSTRNKILRLSLFMEMGMLSVAFGAMLAGLWGMNMVPKAWQFEEPYHSSNDLSDVSNEPSITNNNSKYAFIVTSTIILFSSFLLAMICYTYYIRLSADTKQAQRSAFYALKNYTLVIDEVEARIKVKEDTNRVTTTKVDIDSILYNVVNAQPDEADLIHKTISVDKVDR